MVETTVTLITELLLIGIQELRYALTSKVVKTKLTDVVDDCLEQIFQYLDAKELFSVAVTHERFIFAAGRAFRRVYGKRMLNVDLGGVWYYEKLPGVDSQMTCRLIEFVHPFNLFTFLRIFGDNVSCLNITADVNIKTKSLIENYVAEYCSKSVVNLHFRACISMDLITQTKVNHVEAEEMFRNDNQIEAMAIEYRDTWDIGLAGDFFNNHQLQLDTLSILCHRGYFALFESETLYLAKIKRFTMELLDRFPQTPPPINFGALEVLELKGRNYFPKQWLDFIKPNRNLEQLKIIIDLYIIDVKRDHQIIEPLRECIRMLPKLQVLTIHVKFIQFDFLAGFLMEFDHLLELRLYWESLCEIDLVAFEEPVTKLNGVKSRWQFHRGVRSVTFIREQN